MLKIVPLFLYYFKNYYRSRAFYMMLAIDLLVSSLLVYFSFTYLSSIDKYLSRIVANPPPELIRRVFDYVWNFALEYLPVLSAVFFGSPAISSEIENRTAYQIFPLPVGRFQLFAGKFLAAYVVSVLISGIFLLFQWITFLFVFHILQPDLFYLSILLLLVFIFSILSVTFMSSAIFNKNLNAYITVLVIYFLIFPSASYVINIFYGYTPYYLLTVAAAILQQVYFNFSVFSFSGGFSINPAPVQLILRSLWVMILYGVISFTTALILFERKEAI